MFEVKFGDDPTLVFRTILRTYYMNDPQINFPVFLVQ